MRSKDVIRTYIGHSKAVKDICFNNDGAPSLIRRLSVLGIPRRNKVAAWVCLCAKIIDP